MRYDLAIIGSGGAAFAAAISASRRGASVVMVEGGQVGGTCVNVGCIPSKALLAAAEARHVAADQAFPGIVTRSGPVAAGELFAGKDALVGQLRAGKYTDLVAEHGWELVAGTAVFAQSSDGPVLNVTAGDGATRQIEAGQYLVATGSAPSAPPIGGLTDAGFLTSTSALALGQLPESLVVLGASAVGLELAQLFARLGTKVTLLEARDRLAPAEEPEISAGLAAVLADEGIAAHAGVRVTAVRRDHTGYTLDLTAAGTLTSVTGQQLLVATGRRPATAGLGLETVGVAVGSRGEVVIDERHRSSNPRIWAAGDVTGGPQFVYVAAAQGSLVADNALTGAQRALDYTTLPRVTFTSPAIASVGLTEDQAISAGHGCDCRTLPFTHLPRALVNRDTRGLLKLVADPGTGRLLGAHALADNAGDLITAAGYALAAGLTVQQLAESWAPYLTTAEALKLAAQTYTRDLATLSCCAA